MTDAFEANTRNSILCVPKGDLTANSINTKANRINAKQNELFVSLFTHTIICEEAMMIHVVHTVVTLPAVMHFYVYFASSTFFAVAFFIFLFWIFQLPARIHVSCLEMRPKDQYV